MNQVRRKLRHALILLLGKSVLDGDILSLNPSKLAQLLPERVQEDRATGSSASIQETYAGDFSCPLRLGKRNVCQKKSCQQPESDSLLSSRHRNASVRHALYSRLPPSFDTGGATLFCRRGNFDAPHRTGLADFPHPALQLPSLHR